MAGAAAAPLDKETIKMRQFLHERVEKKEEQVLKMEASVIQMVNFNLVFQGVILTAIISGATSTLKCRRFALSLLAISLIGSLLNLGLLLCTANKYKDAMNLLDDYKLQRHKHLYGHRATNSAPDMARRHNRNKLWRQRILVLSILVFCILAALNLYAATILPC